MTVSAGSQRPHPAFADERQAQIAELVSTRGRAHIAELTEKLGVTESTIRKDLTALHERGLLKRTHGGALALPSTIERDFHQRETKDQPAKHAIARACLSLLNDGDSVFLDGGTTVDSIARALADPTSPASPMRLSILTTALGVATKIAKSPRIDCLLLGGEVRADEGTVVGALTLEILERFSFNLAFIGASGFSESGVSVGSHAEAAVKASVVERARRVVLPLVHTKVGSTDFAHVCDLDEVDTVVLDESTPALEELCAAHEIELVIARR
jgi:DeoR/GlpR family transcriptional regulator of sugar metabolism